MNKVLNLLGLAYRGRFVVSGEFSTEKAIKSGKAYLCIIAEDASENTKKKFVNMCNFYEKELVFYGDKEHLGQALGQEMRTSVAILDAGLAAAVLKNCMKEKGEK